MAVFDLQSHGPDTFVGTGPRYPWGGLHGGQIVAPALRAAAASVDPVFEAHAMCAYFIRPGDHTEPVRYEVDRIRNGRSFLTRRVGARQAIGAILDAECSFQRPEPSIALQSVPFPDVPGPDGLENSSFSEHFERRCIDQELVVDGGRDGAGRVTAWMRAADDLQQSVAENEPFLHQCWLADMPDDPAIA